MKLADAQQTGLNDNVDDENENEILMKFIQKVDKECGLI